MSKNERKTISRRTRHLTEGAMIAALYAVATIAFAPISYGMVQFRVSEALTLLPVFTPAAIPGLTVGCAIANGIGVATGADGVGVMDILFGSLATLLAAIVSRLARKVQIFRLPILSALSPAVFNGLIIGAELSYILKMPFLPCALYVALGEVVVTFVLGLPLVAALRRLRIFAVDTGEE